MHLLAHDRRHTHTNALGIVNTPRESKDYFWRRDPTKQKEFTMSEFCVRRQSCNRKSKTFVLPPTPPSLESRPLLQATPTSLARLVLEMVDLLASRDTTKLIRLRTRVLDTSGRLCRDLERLALSHYRRE